MKNLIFSILLIVIYTSINAQGFELIFGNAGNDHGHRIFETQDGNYVVIGSTEIIPGSAAVLNIVKIDPFGNLIWNKVVEHSMQVGEVVQNDDDTFTIIGSIVGGTGAQTIFYIINVDSSGNEVSNYSYLIDDIVTHPSFVLTDEHLFFIGKRFITEKFFIAKLSLDAQLIWYKEIETPGYIFNPGKLIKTSDQGFLTTSHNGSGEFYVSKLNANGNLEWNCTLVAFELNIFETYPIELPNGEYFIYGEQLDFGFETFIAKLSAEGDVLWEEDFTGHLTMVEQSYILLENDIVLLGYLHDPIAKTHIVQIDFEGNVIFEKSFGDFQSYGDMIIPTEDNGYLIGSRCYPGGGFSTDPYLAKLDEFFELEWEVFSSKIDYFLVSDIFETSTNEYLILGKSEEMDSLYQYRLIKVNNDGIIYEKLVSGLLFYDESENCQYELGETELKNWIVKAEGIQTRYGTTDEAGSFEIAVNGDSVNLSVILPNDYWTNCMDEYFIDLSQSDTAFFDIPVQAASLCPALSVDMSTPFLRRCFSNTYYLKICNEGTVITDNLILEVELDSFFEFTASSIPPDTQIGNLLTYEIGNLPYNECIEINIYFDISCDAELGQLHCISSYLSCGNSCGDPEDLIADHECQPNIGAYDPNDKRAFVKDTLITENILPNTDIDYQIRFQNTGTDTAFNIVIADTLSNFLNPETIIPGSSSHPYIFSLSGRNIVTFEFPDIMLPDSNVNASASIGFVNFKISQKHNLPPGTPIYNQASIYFDFNDPIVTNNHLLIVNDNTVGTSFPVTESGAKGVIIYPNPTSRSLFLEVVKSNVQLKIVQVFSLSGIKLKELKVQGSHYNLEIDYERGLYFIRMELDDGSVSTQPFVVN